MNRYIKFVLKHPVIVLTTFLLITIGLGMGMTKIQFDTSITKFLPESDPEYQYYQHIKDIYGDVDTFVVLAVSHENLWRSETFSLMNALLKDLEYYQNYNAQDAARRMKQLEALLESENARISALTQALSDDPVFKRLILRKASSIGIGQGILSGRDKSRLLSAVMTANRLQQQEMIEEIISPLTVEDISGEDDTLTSIRLIETETDGERILPQTPSDFAALKEKLRRNPVFENGIYATGNDGRISDFGFIIRFTDISDSDPIAREILQIVDTYKGQLNILPQGQPLVYVWINNYMQGDLAKFVPLVLLVAILIFFANFKSIRGVILPSVTLLMATVWILGLMGHLGVAITTVGISIPILMIAVGSSYGIHILNQYYADFDYITRNGKCEGLSDCMNHISVTVLLTGLTTFVAFLTLTSHQLSAIREWGLFSAIGICFAVWISASIIPAGLALMPHKKDRFVKQKQVGSRVPVIDKIVRFATHISVFHYRKTLLVTIIILAVSLVGLFRVKVETELLSFFKPDNYIRTSAVQISEKFGGRWGFNILVDSGEVNGVKNPEYLKTLSDLRTWLQAEGNADLNIDRTDGFTDFIKTMHMAMHNDDPAYFRVPDNKWDVWDYLELFAAEDANSDGRADVFEPYVDPEFRTCNILARLSEKDGELIGTAGLTRIFNRISSHLDQSLPAPYSYRITGHPLMIIKSADYIIYGQIQSLLLTLVVIAIVVLLMLRDLRAGFLALIPMSVAVIVNFGVMGWFGIQLDVATSLIAAITIGIGVDDTIHFLNTFKHYRKRGKDVDTAIARTECVAGKAIIFTSLALIFGFSVLEISTFKPLVLFGLLMGVTMVATTIGALVVLPASIKLTGIRLVKSGNRAGEVRPAQPPSAIWPKIEGVSPIRTSEAE